MCPVFMLTQNIFRFVTRLQLVLTEFDLYQSNGISSVPEKTNAKMERLMIG